MRKIAVILSATALALSFAACKDEEDPTPTPEAISDETYAGGLLGTTFNQSASAYEDPTPAVEQAGMVNAFKYGEMFFEHTVTQNNPPFNGLGPLYVRSSCESCHPGYGHGRRMERYRADDWGNGYLLVVYNTTTNAYETSVAGMPQTKAVAPFKPSIDEEKIEIAWLPYTDEWGNRFPDGETYDLIYPEVTIPEDAFYAPLTSPYSQLGFRLETTIGIYGTGLLDAIPDDSLRLSTSASMTPAPTSIPPSGPAPTGLRSTATPPTPSASPTPSAADRCRTPPVPTPSGTSPTLRAATVASTTSASTPPSTPPPRRKTPRCRHSSTNTSPSGTRLATCRKTSTTT